MTSSPRTTPFGGATISWIEGSLKAIIEILPSLCYKSLSKQQLLKETYLVHVGNDHEVPRVNHEYLFSFLVASVRIRCNFALIPRNLNIWVVALSQLSLAQHCPNLIRCEIHNFGAAHLTIPCSACAPINRQAFLICASFPVRLRVQLKPLLHLVQSQVDDPLLLV